MCLRTTFPYVLFDWYPCLVVVHLYLPHAQTAIYDSKAKLFLKQGISHQLGRDAVVRFECENSAIDVIINFLWKIFHKPIDHRTCGFDPPLILGGSVISAGTLHDLRRVKVPGTGPLWNPWEGWLYFGICVVTMVTLYWW